MKSNKTAYQMKVQSQFYRGIASIISDLETQVGYAEERLSTLEDSIKDVEEPDHWTRDEIEDKKAQIDAYGKILEVLSKC